MNIRVVIYLFIFILGLACQSSEINFFVKVRTRLVIDDGTALVYKYQNISFSKPVLILDSSSQLLRFTIPKKLSINRNCEIILKESLLGGRYFEIDSDIIGPDLADGDTLECKVKLLSPVSKDDKEIIKKKIEGLWMSVDSLLSKKDSSNLRK